MTENVLLAAGGSALGVVLSRCGRRARCSRSFRVASSRRRHGPRLASRSVARRCWPSRSGRRFGLVGDARKCDGDRVAETLRDSGARVDRRSRDAVGPANARHRRGLAVADAADRRGAARDELRASSARGAGVLRRRARSRQASSLPIAGGFDSASATGRVGAILLAAQRLSQSARRGVRRRGQHAAVDGRRRGWRFRDRRPADSRRRVRRRIPNTSSSKATTSARWASSSSRVACSTRPTSREGTARRRS